MNQINIKIARSSPQNADIPLPSYATEGSSGMDVHACVAEPLAIEPGETVLISTGFHLEVPPGYEVQVRPRSGLAIRHGVGILNSPGTIDSDYRGEIKIILTNFGKKVFTVARGDRIAQLVVAPVVRAVLVETDALQATVRGEGGFGHTGQHMENPSRRP